MTKHDCSCLCTLHHTTCFPKGPIASEKNVEKISTIFFTSTHVIPFVFYLYHLLTKALTLIVSSSIIYKKEPLFFLIPFHVPHRHIPHHITIPFSYFIKRCLWVQFFPFLQMPRNPLQLLAHFFPKRCSCLKRWKIARRKCILCLANGAIYHCPRCGFAYCKECFNDIDLNCLLCIAEQEVRQKQNDVIPTSPRTTMSNNDQHSKRRNDSVV